MSDYLQKVDELFGVVSREQMKSFEKIDAPATELSTNGEVSHEWLKKYADFKTWNDFRFVCGDHCNEEFSNLFLMISHIYENYLQKKNLFLKCPVCFKKFVCKYFSASLPNHIIKEHKFECLKFCCVVCSKNFHNMPYLMSHYQDHHPDLRLRLFPCLECGFYAQNLGNLKKHISRHSETGYLKL